MWLNSSLRLLCIRISGLLATPLPPPLPLLRPRPFRAPRQLREFDDLPAGRDEQRRKADRRRVGGAAVAERRNNQ